MPSTMRALDIHGGKGGISALYINDSTPIPQPTPSQAIVKIKYFGINRMDLLQREGRYPVPPQAPSTLGVEFSGTIVSLPQQPQTPPPQNTSSSNPKSSNFKPGDEVFGLAYGGAYAEYIAVNTSMLLPKPPHLTWETAAAIPEAWLTALQAMYLIGEYGAGKSILWHAGASSVSIAGIQLASAASASQIFVTASSTEKIDFCKSLGATEGFNYKTQDWAGEVLKATEGRAWMLSLIISVDRIWMGI